MVLEELLQGGAVVVVYYIIQRIGRQPKNIFLHGGRSRALWSTDQEKKSKNRKSGSLPPLKYL